MLFVQNQSIHYHSVHAFHAGSAIAVRIMSRTTRIIILATEAENGLCREVVEATGLKPVVPT